jgi:acetolactate synthase-1/2/3 large subunit
VELSGAQTVVHALRALGVRHVFTLPGTGIMQTLDALVDVPEIDVITTRHEQISTHMADGYARVTGEPGVVLVSRGPGATNTLSGVLCAWPACSPLVVIAGQVPTAWQGREAFEEYDLVTMFRPTTKYAFEVERVQTLPEVLRRAFKEATTGRPGPVLVSIPFDLLQQRADVAIHPGRYRAPGRLRPEAAALEQAADLLVRAARPAMFVGGGVSRSGAHAEVEALADLLALPVVPTSETDVLATHSPLYVPGATDYVRDADVLLAVGCRFTEFATEAWTLLPAGVRLVHLDIDPFQIEKVYPAEVGLIGDAKAALAELVVAVRDRLGHAPPTAAVADRRAQVMRRKAQFLAQRWPDDDASDPVIRPWHLIRGMRAALADDAYLVEDCASLGAWMERCFDFRTPGTHLRDIGGTMGFGLAAAAGVKLARPTRQVVCFAGDGAFMMVSAALNTMVTRGLGVLTLIWNNQAFLTTGYRYPRVPANALVNPDLARVAEIMGAHAERIARRAEIGPAVRRALEVTASGRPAAVEVVTTPDPRYANPGTYFGRPGAYRHGTPPLPEAYHATPIRS